MDAPDARIAAAAALRRIAVVASCMSANTERSRYSRRIPGTDTPCIACLRGASAPSAPAATGALLRGSLQGGLRHLCGIINRLDRKSVV